MPEKKTKSEFAPAGRADQTELESQVKIMENIPIIRNISNAVSNMIVILNKHRQIIFANKLFLDFLGIKEHSPVIGKRPGEAVACIHSDNTSGGCGTSEFCSRCGAINAILISQGGEQSVKECRIITTAKEALDLKVTATPYSPNGEMYTIFAIEDISDEKRRQTLERVFFHDVLNSAGGISALSDILQQMNDPSEIAEIAQMINRSAANLVEEIKAQRNLSAAERNDYTIEFSNINSLELLQDLSKLYSKHDVIADKHISIDQDSESFNFNSDIVLMRRILGNMIKNALEASLPQGAVTLQCKLIESHAFFSVHNNNYIQRENQLQLFKRSFSTKGAGRGLGTYSMKLFGEKYLKGKVWFETDHKNGTTFFVKVPAE